jgi:putative transposase
MKKRFSEEKIIKILDAAVAGSKIEELCGKHGISAPTYYNWKAKFRGMTIAEMRR